MQIFLQPAKPSAPPASMPANSGFSFGAQPAQASPAGFAFGSHQPDQGASSSSGYQFGVQQPQAAATVNVCCNNFFFLSTAQLQNPTAS